VTQRWMDVWMLAQYPLVCMAMILAGCISTYIIVTVRHRIANPPQPHITPETYNYLQERIRLLTLDRERLNATVDANSKMILEATSIREELRLSKEENAVGTGERVALEQRVKDLQDSIQKLLDESMDEDLGGDLMSAVIRRRGPPRSSFPSSQAWCRVCGSNVGVCSCRKDPHTVYEGVLPPPSRPPEPFN